jgi:hypothetical protein
MRSISLRIAITLLVLSGIIVKAQGQNNMQRSMIQYLFPDFDQSVIMMKNGEEKTTIMNFNTVTEKLVFISDRNYYDLMNPEIVDTVYLNGCKFIPVGKVFYEVLLSDPIALFIQHKSELIEKGVPVGYGGTSQLAKSVYITSFDAVGGTYNLELPENYTVKQSPVYWIRKGNEMLSFTNQKQYLTLFPEKTNDIKSYIKQFRLKFSDKEDLVKIVKYSGSI